MLQRYYGKKNITILNKISFYLEAVNTLKNKRLSKHLLNIKKLKGLFSMLTYFLIYIRN
jgi:hypothetical protein